MNQVARVWQWERAAAVSRGGPFRSRSVFFRAEEIRDAGRKGVHVPLGVRVREEERLELAGRGVDPPVEQKPEAAREPRGVGRLRRRVIDDRARG